MLDTPTLASAPASRPAGSMAGAEDYLRETWHMAGWSHEYGEALIRRRICGPAVLLFRREDGAVVHQAFDDEDKPMIEAAYANLAGKDFREIALSISGSMPAAPGRAARSHN